MNALELMEHRIYEIALKEIDDFITICSNGSAELRKATKSMDYSNNNIVIVKFDMPRNNTEDIDLICVYIKNIYKEKKNLWLTTIKEMTISLDDTTLSEYYLVELSFNIIGMYEYLNTRFKNFVERNSNFKIKNDTFLKKHKTNNVKAYFMGDSISLDGIDVSFDYNFICHRLEGKYHFTELVEKILTSYRPWIDNPVLRDFDPQQSYIGIKIISEYKIRLNVIMILNSNCRLKNI